MVGDEYDDDDDGVDNGADGFEDISNTATDLNASNLSPTNVSLTVHLPASADGPQRSLQLPRYDDEDNKTAITVQCSRLMESDDRYSIFEGSLLSSESSVSPVRVVCKLSSTDEGMDGLAMEDTIYRALKDLQGKVTPRCYGYFEDLKVAGCLVLEYAGEPLQRCFHELSDELK